MYVCVCLTTSLRLADAIKSRDATAALEETCDHLRRAINTTVPAVADLGTPISELAHGELVSHGTLELNKYRSWYSVNRVDHVTLHGGSANIGPIAIFRCLGGPPGS
jgi:hypothetical protein